jgi:8-oxo-dGTP diphosphatase
VSPLGATISTATAFQRLWPFFLNSKMTKIQVPCPHCGKPIETFRNPYPTVDIIFHRPGEVLLIRRRNEPPGWALPGGFVDYGESAEQAAQREAREETGLAVRGLQQFRVYSQPGRDPRFHTLTVVFIAEPEGELHAGDDAADARWFALDNLPTDMAFDHARVIADARTAGLIA